MIFTFTDFGIEGPYMGQMRAAVLTEAPGVEVVDLMVDVPAFNPRAAAYLLAAISMTLPSPFVCLAVVDPGVGSARRPIILQCGENRFVGPENGLFEIAARRSEASPEWFEITWRPEQLSSSFHGRDLFAPVAAMLARDGASALARVGKRTEAGQSLSREWPDDLDEVIYIDGYGNCMLGRRWPDDKRLLEVTADSVRIGTVETFSDVPRGEVICYKNSLGLVEIAVNQGSAAARLDLQIGSQLAVRKLSGK